ncbi:B- and T-lymphocyte attenuator isoform X2 [Oryctolagus cuniculus]|uniref:B- and T-lymphocyte attenuator isoform X2 n=1 Tax=Oryctolagus cuniculus TaxID=9986 RepID=UPI0038794299
MKTSPAMLGIGIFLIPDLCIWSICEKIQNNSQPPLMRPPSKEEMADSPWLLYGLLASGGLPLLLITCFCLLCCLRGHPGKQKKPFDAAGREINLVDVPQLVRSEQADVGTRKNSQTLPPETGIYDNDPWFKMQEGSEVYSNPYLEETKQGIVYASLNHAIIGMNPRQAKNEKEEPTEYASICVRS